MIGPTIEPSEVGLTGLLWLFLSYGYVLYYASNLIGEGSELLLLVPSLAGLVGGVVLPLLGAVPDGAIILFSGLGSLEDAQESLAVGVGALAGSTIMLLTVPLALSAWRGKVDLLSGDKANYLGRPKLTEKSSMWATLTKTGVAVSDPIHQSAAIMMATTIPYFLIQVPALYLHGPSEEVAAGEHWWAAAAFCICLIGLFFYMRLQLKMSQEGQDRGKRMAVVRKLLQKGKVSLSGAVASHVQHFEEQMGNGVPSSEYQSILEVDPRRPPPAVFSYLKEILADAFMTYDEDANGHLDEGESFMFFRDFHEAISEEEMKDLFSKFDSDKSGTIDLDEFIGLAYALIKIQVAKEKTADAPSHNNTRAVIADAAFAEIEEEEIPEDLSALPPEQQQVAIKQRAFTMLALGTTLVVLFSDPMVDVMQEIAVRANLSPFYVSFILAPLASNASEVISSQYYASKKTSKTIQVSLSALVGAASTNNTFCLSIFMGLIFFRGLAWQYTAETLAIILVEFLVGFLVRNKILSTGRGLLIGAVFPLSIALVATLEALGFD
ncbi:hypothetical protein FisN_17Hh108 [Fistulifera solaris]|jgi:Ca2+/Na+ antiporter|uniref:EF-hand domain-containing protein n=1 Tax=Fistulifera solaris TaxID=1519565 RepID=A0A1Z5JHC5_FISSO|nr:hypothetical protein FisN_17Hh108 [Fistulifera solaris]|eukprot:GAX13178.1 hypothetical protein FisN_17Hh108 [Fistulifera solaris]